jgi:hypothetical protein
MAYTRNGQWLSKLVAMGVPNVKDCRSLLALLFGWNVFLNVNAVRTRPDKHIRRPPCTDDILLPSTSVHTLCWQHDGSYSCVPSGKNLSGSQISNASRNTLESWGSLPQEGFRKLDGDGLTIRRPHAYYWRKLSKERLPAHIKTDAVQNHQKTILLTLFFFFEI